VYKFLETFHMRPKMCSQHVKNPPTIHFFKQLREFIFICYHVPRRKMLTPIRSATPHAQIKISVEQTPASASARSTFAGALVGDNSNL
jgi:hypothetical protein